MSTVDTVTRTGRDVLLAPLATLLAIAARPAVLAAAAVLLVCVPGGDRDPATVNLTAADLASAALVAAAAARALVGDRLPPARLWVVLAVGVLGCAVATFATPDPLASLPGFVRYLQLFVLVPVAVTIALRTRRDLVIVCGAVLIAALIQGLVGTHQYLTRTGAAFGGRPVRAVGTFSALDVMGMSTVVGYGLVVAVGLALVLRGPTRYVLLALAAFLALPLVFSLSRGALVATMVALAVMLIAASPRLALRTAVFGAAVVVVAVGVLGTPGGVVAQRVATVRTALAAPDRSVTDRFELWQTAVGMWRDSPVTGVGPKMFPRYRDSYAPLHMSSGSDVADRDLGFRRASLLSPHNMYLLVLSEQGLFGGLAFAGLLAGLGVATWRRTRRAAGPIGPPDARVHDGRLVSAVAVGVVTWTAVNFLYADIGGASSVFISVLLGVALWWATRPLARESPA